jgi:hypothetical protein
MENRTLSLGDNSFDADNSAYNLYAFVVRIKSETKIYLYFYFPSVIMVLLVVVIMYHLLKIVRMIDGIVLMIVHAK